MPDDPSVDVYAPRATTTVYINPISFADAPPNGAGLAMPIVGWRNDFDRGVTEHAFADIVYIGTVPHGPGFFQAHLTIQSDSTLTTNAVHMATVPGASATLTLGAVFGKESEGFFGTGTLETKALTAGPGAAQVNVEVGTIRALANNDKFITGFSGTQFDIRRELVIDTNGFNVIVPSTLSGDGALGKLGKGTLTLTGANTYRNLTIVEDGTLLVNGSIQSFATEVNPAGALGGTGIIFGDVANIGTVAPGASIGTLTIVGNYEGDGGTLAIETVLGDDSSATDQLVIKGAGHSASGMTGIVVTNLGGPGAMTRANGIPIVVAQDGATTEPTAFALAKRVAAGPFEYLLFRGPSGAGTADEQNTWYLRSHATSGGGGGGSGGGPGPVIPLYRPETATYGLFPALARDLAVTTLGTFHERNGDQRLVAGSKRERLWGRVFGQHTEQSHGGHVTPSLDGYAAGFQAGADAYETVWENGVLGRAGIFVGYGDARGDISGSVLGQLQAAAGDAQLEATSMGGYGTLIGRGGWYVDSVLMSSFYSGTGSSTNRIGVSTDGWSLLGSLEAGIPFRLGGGLTLEPQAQLIYQHLAFDDAIDPFSTVSFNTPDAVSGRIGVRLAGAFADGRLRPYLKANLWQDWLDKDGVIYAGTHRLDTEHGGTAVEVGGGVVAELMPGVGLWGVIDYTSDIAGDTERETLRGNAGVRITW